MKRIILLAIAALMTISAVAGTPEKSKKTKEVKEVTFNVHLHCANCVKKVQENISFEKGVKDLHVCMEDQIVYIKYDAAKTSEETLKAAIQKLGYPVSGKVSSEHGHSHSHKH